MVDCLIVSLRLVSSIVLLGVQLVVSQQSIDHRKVPQRIEQQSDTAANFTTVQSGTWGNWGPWSACSRSCSGGVMEQTRPCLPPHYQERSYQAPSEQYSAGERTHSYQNNFNHDTVISPYSGHVVSAIRTSIPLHRRGENPRFNNVPSSGDLSQKHQDRGTLRGGRQLLLPGQISKHEKRNRTQGLKSPGSYGYGKVPYALPLQSDTGQAAQRTRRQRPSIRQSAYKQNTDTLINQWQATRSEVSSIPQGLYPDISRHGFASLQLLQEKPQMPRGATSITCIGPYKQHKLCNKNLCPGSNRAIREVQCASYNNKPFMGRLYEWEPFIEGPHDCRCRLEEK